MQIRFVEHPSEDSLERYVLHHSDSSELESIETHILACPDCVTRLELAQLYIATVKEACKELHHAPAAKQKVDLFAVLAKLTGWLTPLRLSWTAGFAALIALLIVAPAQFALRWPVSPAQVNLAAWRGTEAATVPSKRPLNVRLNSVDLPDGAIGVQLVDAGGREISHGSASISQESTQVALPPLQHPGTYFLRLYSVSDTKSGERDLLREFAFQAR